MVSCVWRVFGGSWGPEQREATADRCGVRLSWFCRKSGGSLSLKVIFPFGLQHCCRRDQQMGPGAVQLHVFRHSEEDGVLCPGPYACLWGWFFSGSRAEALPRLLGRLACRCSEYPWCQ